MVKYEVLDKDTANDKTTANSLIQDTPNPKT